MRKIRPVVRFGNVPWYIKPTDPRKIAFAWDPKKAAETEGLQEVCEITTYHLFGYHGFFKPSVAEVLAQIPEEYLDNAVAFEIIKWPKTVDDLNLQSEVVRAGYHQATTRLYTL